MFTILQSGNGYTIQDVSTGLYANSPGAQSPPNKVGLSSTPTIWTAIATGSSGSALPSGTYNFEDSAGNTIDAGWSASWSNQPYVFEYSYNNGSWQQFTWSGGHLQVVASGSYLFNSANTLGIGSAAGTFNIVQNGSGYTIQDASSGLYVNSPGAQSPPNKLSLSSTPTTWMAIAAGSSGGAPSSNSACQSLAPPDTDGPVVHVAIDGSDAGDGSAANPFATLQRALQDVAPGTRVLLGGGTYSLASTIRLSDIHGTAPEPIVIMPEPGASPVFDGSAVTDLWYDNEPYIHIENSSYIYIDGIEIVGRPYPSDVTSHLSNGSTGVYTGTPYRGSAFGALNSSFVTLARSRIHQIPNGATIVSGSDFVIACNQVQDVVLENTNNQRYFQTGWPSAFGEGYLVDANGNFADWTRRVQYLNNTLVDSWGEGINCGATDTCDVIGNEIANTFSVEIYVDHGRNIRIVNNRLHDNAWNGTGIAIDDEQYYGSADGNPTIPYIPEDNVLIANNFIGKTPAFVLYRYDISCADAPGACTTTPAYTWSHWHIINNTFAGGADWYNGQVFSIQRVTGSTAPFDGVIANNIFLDTTGLDLQDASAWTVENNIFVGGTPSITPSGVATSGNVSVDPQFPGPVDGSSWAGITPGNTGALQVPLSSDAPGDALGNSRNNPTTAGAVGP
jgi:hypothetical protein